MEERILNFMNNNTNTIIEKSDRLASNPGKGLYNTQGTQFPKKKKGGSNNAPTNHTCFFSTMISMFTVFLLM